MSEGLTDNLPTDSAPKRRVYFGKARMPITPVQAPVAPPKRVLTVEETEQIAQYLEIAAAHLAELALSPHLACHSRSQLYMRLLNMPDEAKRLARRVRRADLSPENTT